MTLTKDQVLQARSNAQEQLDEAESALQSTRSRLAPVINRVDEWLWQNTEHNADSIIAEYVELRDKRAEIKKAYEAEDEDLKRKMNLRETWLLEKIEKDNLESLRTEHGTAYTQVKTRFNVADWPNYWAWLGRNERFDLLEKRPAQAALAKMEKEGEEMPPGLNQYSERVVTVRRA